MCKGERKERPEMRSENAGGRQARPWHDHPDSPVHCINRLLSFGWPLLVDPCFGKSFRSGFQVHGFAFLSLIPWPSATLILAGHIEMKTKDVTLVRWHGSVSLDRPCLLRPNCRVQRRAWERTEATSISDGQISPPWRAIGPKAGLPGSCSAGRSR